MDEQKVNFEVSTRHLAEMGALTPGSVSWQEACDRLGLSSEERLYCSLAKTTSLQTCIFGEGQMLGVAGLEVGAAYIVMVGCVELVAGSSKFMVGPGSVIGLAEGLAMLPHTWTATARSSVVSALVIQLHSALSVLSRANPGLKGIERCTVMRTLDLADIPQTFK